MFPLLFGGVFSSISARVAAQNQRPVVAVRSRRRSSFGLTAARDQVGQAIADDKLVTLAGFSPQGDLVAQQKRLLAGRSPPVRAVLSGGLDHPRLAGALANDPGTVGQLRLLIANARSGSVSKEPDLPVSDVAASTGAMTTDRTNTAQIGQTSSSS